MFAAALRFLGDLKKDCPDLEWLLVREWSRWRLRPHGHALLRTGEALTQAWVSAVSREEGSGLRVKLRDVYHAAGAIDYVLKANDFKRLAQMAPPWYRGRLTWPSKGWWWPWESGDVVWKQIQADRKAGNNRV
jgi:hypothetical protein